MACFYPFATEIDTEVYFDGTATRQEFVNLTPKNQISAEQVFKLSIKYDKMYVSNVGFGEEEILSI